MKPPLEAIVEISKNSRRKSEYDPKTGKIVLEAILPSHIRFPENYGFIPHTLSGDGDPLDVFVIHSRAYRPGRKIPIRVVGVIRMIDEGEEDHKLIACPDVPAYQQIRDIKDVPARTLKRIESFLVRYKAYRNQKIELPGYRSAAIGKKIIQKSWERFQKKE